MTKLEKNGDHVQTSARDRMRTHHFVNRNAQVSRMSALCKVNFGLGGIEEGWSGLNILRECIHLRLRHSLLCSHMPSCLSSDKTSKLNLELFTQR